VRLVAEVVGRVIAKGMVEGETMWEDEGIG